MSTTSGAGITMASGEREQTRGLKWCSRCLILFVWCFVGLCLYFRLCSFDHVIVHVLEKLFQLIKIVSMVNVIVIFPRIYKMYLLIIIYFSVAVCIWFMRIKFIHSPLYCVSFFDLWLMITTLLLNIFMITHIKENI